MLQQIVDRRLSGKNKSIANRERFLRRYQGQLKEAVRRAVDKRGIREIEQGEEISLPGFGKFKAKDVAAREGRNPSTGETMTFAAQRKITFQPGKALKDRLQG